MKVDDDWRFDRPHAALRSASAFPESASVVPMYSTAIDHNLNYDQHLQVDLSLNVGIAGHIY